MTIKKNRSFTSHIFPIFSARGVHNLGFHNFFQTRRFNLSVLSDYSRGQQCILSQLYGWKRTIRTMYKEKEKEGIRILCLRKPSAAAAVSGASSSSYAIITLELSLYSPPSSSPTTLPSLFSTSSLLLEPSTTPSPPTGFLRMIKNRRKWSQVDFHCISS